MRGTPGPDAMETCSGSSTVVPGAALPTHVGAGEEGITVCHEIICSALGGRHGSDSLRGDLAKHFGDVCCLDLGSVWDGS